MNLTLLSLFILHFYNDGVRTAVVALVPFLTKEMNLSFTQVGILGSSQGVLGTLLAFPTGYIAGRIGGFRLIVLSLLMYSAGALFIGLSPDYIMLTGAFYLAAVGFGTFHVVGFSLVSRLSDTSRKGRNMGNFTAIGDIGRIALPSAAIFAIPFIGWRASYIVIAAIGLILFVTIVTAGRRMMREHATNNKNTPESHRDWLGHVFALLKSKKLLLILTACMIDGLAGQPIYIFLPFLLIEKGITVTMLGIFSGIYFAGSLIGKTVLGRGVDRFGNKKVFVFAEMSMALCLVLLVLSQHVYYQLALAFVLGLFTRGTVPVLMTLFSEITHEDHYEKVFAVSETFLGITGAAAPILLGYVADTAGISSVFYLAAALSVLAFLPILALRVNK